MEILFSAVDFRFRVSIYYLWKFHESFNETSEATKRFVDLVSSFFSIRIPFSLSLGSRNVTPLYTKWVTWGRGGVCVETLPQVFFYYPDRKRGPRRARQKIPRGSNRGFFSRWKRADDSRDRDRGASRSQFLELASKGNDKYFGQLFIYQKFNELRNLFVLDFFILSSLNFRLFSE